MFFNYFISFYYSRIPIENYYSLNIFLEGKFIVILLYF